MNGPVTMWKGWRARVKARRFELAKGQIGEDGSGTGDGPNSRSSRYRAPKATSRTEWRGD